MSTETEDMRKAYEEEVARCVRVEAELAASESLVTALQEQMARLAEQHAKAVAGAREEQREQDATLAEETRCAGNSESWWAAQTSIAVAIRSTPLASTPLAARIAELENERDEARNERHLLAWDSAGHEEELRRLDGVLGACHMRLTAAESALAAEVERHQATAADLKRADSYIVDLDADKERLRDLVYEVICWNGGIQKRDPKEMFADLAAVFRETASPVLPDASFPAGPRVGR